MLKVMISQVQFFSRQWRSQAEFFELPQLFSVATEVNLQIDIQRKETSYFAAAKRPIKGEKWSLSTVSEQF